MYILLLVTGVFTDTVINLVKFKMSSAVMVQNSKNYYWHFFVGPELTITVASPQEQNEPVPERVQTALPFCADRLGLCINK